MRFDREGEEDAAALIDAATSDKPIETAPCMKHPSTGVENKMEKCGTRPLAAGLIVVVKPDTCAFDVPPGCVIDNRVVSSGHDERHHAANWIKVWHKIAVAPVEQGHALLLSLFRLAPITFDERMPNSPRPVFHSKSV